MSQSHNIIKPLPIIQKYSNNLKIIQDDTTKLYNDFIVDSNIDKDGENKKKSSSNTPPKINKYDIPIDIIESDYIILKIIRINPFLWDGSYLGLITNRNIIDQIEYMDQRYWKLNLFGHIQICIIRQIADSSPCISDELKELFGLPKIGSHMIKYFNKFYLLLKPKINNKGEIIKETSIAEIVSTTNQLFINQVQDIYLFRDVLGMTKTNDNSIIIRCSNQKYIQPYPISFYENKIKPASDKQIIPTTVIAKWFGEYTLNDSARRIFNVSKISEIQEKCGNIYYQLNLIIERVDKNALWLTTHIMKRLSQRLLSGIDNNNDTNENMANKATPEWNWNDSHI